MSKNSQVFGVDADLSWILELGKGRRFVRNAKAHRSSLHDQAGRNSDLRP